MCFVPPSWTVLTANVAAQLQTETTGEAEHEQMEEIEVIFGSFERIDGNALVKCRNLQKLTSKRALL